MLSFVFVTCLLAAIGAGWFGVWLVRTGGPFRVVVRGLLVLDALFVAWGVAPVTLATLPDARDQLSAADRTVVDAALGWSCRAPLVSRMTSVSVGETGTSLSYRCAIGPFGLAFSGEAQCADGYWQVPGFGGPSETGRC